MAREDRPGGFGDIGGRPFFRGRAWMGVFMVLLAINAVAQGAQAPATIDPAASCMTGECHSSMKEYRFGHAPSQAGACDMCHEPLENRHAFAEMPDAPTLCGSCHEPVDTAENVHFPAAEDCMDCHDPHGSSVSAMLKYKDQKETCFQCHDEEILAREYVHGPAGAGACSVCHNPHSSDYEYLLRGTTREMCASCHEDLMEEWDNSANVHEPAKGDCTTCHDPHSGSHPRMLPAAPKDLCGKCHEDVVKKASEAAVKHAPVESENGCVECHAPHGAPYAPLLKRAQGELCLSCHNADMAAGDSEMTDMKKLLDNNPNWHGPVRTGACSGCHDIHGGAHFRLLKEPYPAKFYSPFAIENYALCFTCHEPTLVQDEKTTTLTNFRDGDRNMHFLHVNKKRRGRTCRACHEVHASSNERHIRDTVPYGSWALPINFTKTETGGSCRPGCHAEASYSH
ncbi:MAG: cytochrome C [Nitrospiraceae bacterium]|nr:cytochrome C [Nitrospiraceae bacterium]